MPGGNAFKTPNPVRDSSIAHTRINDGLISRFEKPLLTTLARNLPSWVLPDHLTALGFAAALLTAISLVASHASNAFLLLAVAGILLNWFGDSLDGTLARHRRIERPRYGFFLDHTVDMFAQAAIVLALGFSPLMRIEFALVALVCYFASTIYTLINLHVNRKLQLVYNGVGPTELRILLASGLVLTWANGGVLTTTTPFGILSFFDVVVIALAAGVFVTLGVLALETRRHLDKLEPAPVAPNSATRDSTQGTRTASGHDLWADPAHGMIGAVAPMRQPPAD